MSAAIVKVVEVRWSLGMAEESLATRMHRALANNAGLSCVGVERVTEFHWLMLFAEA